MAVGQGMRRTAGKRVLAGLAVLGIVVISGLLAAWGVTPPARYAVSASDVVALRFPADWTDTDTTEASTTNAGTTGAAAPLATFALASVSQALPSDSAMLFNPNPTWAAPPLPAAVERVPQASVATDPKAEPKPEPKAEIKAESRPEPKAEAKPVVVASRAHAPAHHAASHARRESSVLFNEAQLASIKARLKLSDYQEQYWPAVASALRALGQRAAREPVRQASAYANEGPLSGIDPDGPEVEQLKSAAFPLIMSMNDEQKNQVRMIAHVMGLEQVASSF